MSCAFPEFMFVPAAMETADAGSQGEPIASTAFHADASTGPNLGTSGSSGPIGGDDASAPVARPDSSSSWSRGDAPVVVVLERDAPAPAPSFSDDFERGNDSLWYREKLGAWNVVLREANYVYEQASLSTYPALAVAVTADWTDQAVQARVKVLRFGATQESSFVAVYARYVNTNNCYALAIRADGRVALRRRLDGTVRWLAESSEAVVTPGVWHALRFDVVGASLRGSLDGRTVVEATDTSLRSGGLAIGTINATAQFDDVLAIAE